MQVSASATAVSLLAALLHLVAAAHLPTDYPVCSRNDPNVDECLRKAVSVAVKKVASGIPSLGVVPLDPLDVPRIEISDGTSNINLKITFRNVHVSGLSKANVMTASFDFPKDSLRFSGVEPHLVFEADYTMDGKFLVVPVQGSGRCKFIFTNMSAELTVESERRTKASQNYWEVLRFITNITNVDLMQINFENLFNGDATLGPGFNKLLNENWTEFWGALRPTFEESFGLIFKDFAYRVFSKVPLDEIFPPK